MVKSAGWANKKSHCSNIGRLLQLCKTRKGRSIVGNKNRISDVGRALEACKRSKAGPKGGRLIV